MENYVKRFRKIIFECFYRKFCQNLSQSKNGFLTTKLDIKSVSL